MLDAPVPFLTASANNASSFVMRSQPGAIIDFQVNTNAVAGWVMLHDRATAPTNGAVTPRAVWQVPANSTLTVNYAEFPANMATGAVLTFSTTGPTTLTLSATAWFGGRVR